MLRVNSPETPMLTLIEAQIRQAGAAAGVEVEHAPTVGADALPADTLWDLLAELEIWRGNDLLEPVLIFDQFEELFTLPWSPDDRAAFIEQFGEVVRHHRVPGRDADPARQALAAPNVKIVMCMREDFIGQLEELAVSVPQIMNRRFRLGALDPVQADAAIREPAELDDPRLRTQRFSYSAGAASTILTFLRTKDDRGNTVLTESIDPSQLQIICQHVERTILPQKTVGTDGRVEITESDLGGPDGLRRIVVDFYRQVLDAFPQRERRAVRHLCETGLISQSGRRLSLEEGEIGAHFNVSLDTLRKLVDLRLLRSEPRVGSVYYELAHDTLTGPILAYRDHKRKERRRRLMVAALILAAVVAATIAGLLLASRGDVDEQPAARPVLPVEVGQSVRGEISSTTDTAVYEVGATDEPLVVELRPSGFNGALELSRLGSSVAPQVQDASGSGAPEFAMIGAGETKHRIEVSGLGAGEFELMVRPANSSRLSIPSRDRTVPIQSTGQPTVLAVDGSAGEAFVVTVEVTRNGETEEIPDAARLEIVDPDGVTTAALHDQPTSLSALGGGKAGTYLVGIADASGQTKRKYSVSISPVAITSASLGVPNRGVVERARTVRRCPIRVTRRQRSARRAPRRQPCGTRPDPVSRRHGAGVVGSWWNLDADRRRRALHGVHHNRTRLSRDAEHRCRRGRGSGARYERSRNARRRPWCCAVSSGGDWRRSTTRRSHRSRHLGRRVEPGRRRRTGRRACRPRHRGRNGASDPSARTRGPLLFAITPYADTSGGFQFSVRQAEVTEIATGETISGHLEPGQIELYSLTATDSPFAVAVTSADLGAELGVDGPQGEEFPQIDNVFLSSGVAGEYMLTVRGFESPVDFQISADELPPLDSGDIAPGAASISGPGDIDVLGVELPDDPIESVTITADPGLEVDAMVTDSFGNEVGRTSGPVAGSALVTLLDASGPHFVIVTGVSGTGAVKVAVKAIEEEPLTPGTPVTFVAVAGQVALFTLEQGDGLFAIEIRPSQGVTTSLAVIDTIGNLFGGEESLDSPDLLVVDARYGPLRVFVGPTEGSGEIALLARPIATLPLELGETLKGAIRAPGDVIAYDVTVGDLELLASVLPSADLDVQVTVIDSIAFLETTDVLPAGDGEDALLVGEPGLFRVIVSGVGGSSGDFEVALEEATPDSGI